ncbi:MAG: rhodanese-like domain-containing protein [Clostridia bacterium]|nr:rhodanese-like domain-containing protein [Clostridia bacterium]
MKKTLLILLSAAMLTTLLVPFAMADDTVYQAAFNYFRDFPSDRNVIAAADLFTMMDNGDEMLIVDIRRPDDYAAGHLIGAVNLSFFDMSIPENLDALPDDRPIMVYCYTGQTASQVTALVNIADKMAKNVQSGFNNAISKEEGFEKYIETADHMLPDAGSPVDAVLLETITEYFAGKMALDGTPMANYNLSAETVKTIVDDQDDNYVILSIRRAEDYEAGHIAGAVNIPYGQGMEEALSQLPADKTIVVYCYSGQTSSQTTAVLRLMGYDAYSMSGGMGNADAGTGWLGQGYEVVME